MMARRVTTVAGTSAFVTGSTQGIGRAIAEALAASGHSVIGVDVIDQDPGPLASVIRADLALADTGERLAAEVGRVDVLVNNAAILVEKPIEETSVEEFDLTIAVNLRAPFLLSRAFGAGMRERGWGRIINISSSAGRMVSTLGGAHYTASKAGLLGLTRASAKELGKFGITVNAICPGMIDTELTRENADDELLQRLAASYPVPRLGTALEVADLICFAASEAAGYITGASLDINGGDLMM